ncbi:MAG: GAF domain-containing protein, partial [Spirochaetota bacterium]|nr:GAF domain-containing protein [Spirochaetota bacterium]
MIKSEKQITFAQLNTLSSYINSAEDLNTLLAYIMNSAKEIIDCEATSLILLDEKSKTLKFHVITGEDKEILTKQSFPMGTGIAGLVAGTCEAVISNDAQSDDRVFQEIDEISNFKTNNLLCVPMKVRNKIIGVLEAINATKGHFTEDDKTLLAFLANEAAIAIHNRLLFSRLDKANQELNSRIAELKYLYELT